MPGPAEPLIAGVTVQYEQYDSLSHTTSILWPWLPQAVDWIKDRFADRPPPNNCSSIEPGNPLDLLVVR